MKIRASNLLRSYNQQLLRFPLRRFSMQPPDFDPNKDYYKVLGVPPSSSEKDIKLQYYKLAQ